MDYRTGNKLDIAHVSSSMTPRNTFTLRLVQFINLPSVEKTSILAKIKSATVSTMG